MKKLFPLTGLLFIILLMTGCLTALHPLFTEKELIHEPRLLGSWIVSGDDSVIVNFEKGTPESFGDLPEVLQKASSRAYIVTVKDLKGNIAQKFYAFPTKLGDGLYLDYFAATTPVQKTYDAFYLSHYNAMHSFYKIRFNNNGSFKVSRLKSEFLENLIRNKQINIRHEQRSDGSFVITAPTAELQQYVLKYGQNKDAYESTDTYSKIN